MNPYRSTPETSPPKTVSIETDDVEAIVYYLDIDGEVKDVKANFLGKPSANYDRGSSRFQYWLEHSFAVGIYTVNDTLLIPMHRLLKIEKTITERTATVEVERITDQ